MRIRRLVNRFILWQWKKMSRISALIYKFIGVFNGNGKHE